MASNAKRKMDAYPTTENIKKITRQKAGIKTTVTTKALENSLKQMIKYFDGKPTKYTNTSGIVKPNLAASRDRVSQMSAHQITPAMTSSDNKDEWELPKNPRKVRKISVSPKNSNNSPNTFDPLASNWDDNVLELEQTLDDTTQFDKNEENDKEQDSESNKKRIRPPPIYVINTSIKEMIK